MLQVLYLVKWVGWDEETWEPEGNLEGSEILIADYQQRQSEESSSGAEKQNNSEDGEAFEEMPTDTELPSKKLLHSSDPVDLCASVGGVQTATKDTDASQRGRDSITYTMSQRMEVSHCCGKNQYATKPGSAVVPCME